MCEAKWGAEKLTCCSVWQRTDFQVPWRRKKVRAVSRTECSADICPSDSARKAR